MQFHSYRRPAPKRVAVVDAATLLEVKSIKTAGPTDAILTSPITNSADIVPKVDQIAFDPAGGLLYWAGADKMTVLRTTGGKLLALGEVTTAATAKNVAVDTRVVWTTYTDGKSSFAKSWTPPSP